MDDRINRMRLTFLLLLLACFLFGTLSPSGAHAQLPTVQQDPVDPEATQTQVVSRELVESLKSQIESSTELKDDDKQASLGSIQDALNELTAAAELLNRERNAKNELSNVDKTRTTLQNELEKLNRSQPDVSPQADEELVKLGQDLAVKKANLVETQSRLNSLETRIDSRAETQRAKKDRLAAIPAEVEAIKKRHSQLPPKEEDTLVSKAERFSLLASKKRLEIEPAALQTELALSSAKEAVALPQLERELANIQVERLKQEVQAYTDAVNKARRENARTLKEDIEKEAELARESKEPWERKLADVLKSTIQLIEIELNIQSKLQLIQGQIAETKEEREALADSLHQVKSRESRIGSSRSFGIRLRTQRENLPGIDVLESQIRERAQTYEQTQIAYFEKREERKALDDLEDEIRSVLPKSNHDIEVSDELLLAEHPAETRIRNAFLQQRDALDRVILIYDQYAEELDNYDAEQTQLADLSKEFANYIDRRVLWIRSHDPLSFGTLTHDVQSLKVFTHSGIWTSLRKIYATDFWEHLFVYSLMIVVWTFLIVTQSRQSCGAFRTLSIYSIRRRFRRALRPQS